MNNQPQDLYTVATLATFVGSSGAVLVLYNTFRKLFTKDSVWVAFIISLIVSFVVAIGTDALGGVLSLFLAFLNACLLFTSASGAQEIVASNSQVSTRGFSADRQGERNRFWSSWFKR